MNQSAPSPYRDRPLFRKILTLPAALILLSAAALTAGAEGAEGADSLWERTVDHYGRRMEAHYPETAREKVQVLDKQGNPDSEIISVYAQAPSGPESLERTVQSSQKNGRDRTAKAREDLAKGKEKSDENEDNLLTNPIPLNPLYPSLQEHLTVERRKDNVTLSNGRLYAVYDFAYTHPRTEAQKEAGEEAYRFPGTLWLEADLGIPHKLTFTMEPLPDKVKHLEGTSYYRQNEAGFPVILESEHTLQVQAMVFITKNLSISTEYSDFVPWES